VLLAKGIQVPEEIKRGGRMKGIVHSVYGRSGSGKTMFMLYLVKGASREVRYRASN
jgi:hypothetical protein